MRSYIELIGTVTKAPEIRVLPNGDRLALLIIETTETWHDCATGERRSRSTWHDVRISKAGIVKAIERTNLSAGWFSQPVASAMATGSITLRFGARLLKSR